MEGSFANTTVVVTGAQGFIGCWLAERLLDEGARVIAPIRSFAPAARFNRDGVARRCAVESVDVTDQDAMASTLIKHRAELVFHLAAQPLVAVANRSPHSTWESNVRGAYSVLGACRAAGTQLDRTPKVVLASSDHAYGDHESLPYREDYTFRARYPYDVSKACADMLARSFAATYEMPVAVTRMANTFGGGDLNWSRIVPDSSRALIAGNPPVLRSDGTPERDYLYVEDAISAYLAVAHSLEDVANYGRAWNVGLGEPVSVLELVRILIGASGRELEPEVRGEAVPQAEIDRLYPDSTAIRNELGWEPRWSLHEGLESTYAWYERHLDSTRTAAATGS